MPGESLRVTEGKAEGTAIELGDEFVIGRAMVGEGRLGEDPELSRRHARIVRRAGDQLTIEDLGSTNGTYLNGRQLDGTEVLRAGDTVKVGTTTLQVLDASGQAPQATAFGKVPEPKDQATVLGERRRSPRATGAPSATARRTAGSGAPAPRRGSSPDTYTSRSRGTASARPADRRRGRALSCRRARRRAALRRLAVIQLTPRPQGLKAATLGDSSDLVAGDAVTALGFPGAFEADIINTVSAGGNSQVTGQQLDGRTFEISIKLR